MTANRIAVTGMGLVSALGWSPKQTWSAICEERSGLSPLTLFRVERHPCLMVGEVREDPAARSGVNRGSRTEHLALHAARQAFEDAGLTQAQATNAGVVLGVCTGGMLDTETYVEATLAGAPADPSLLRHHECSGAANAVAKALGLGGPCETVSVACISGALAIAIARDLIQSGEADVVLAGGADSLTRLTLCGFLSLLVVAPEGCTPFDAERKGMCLGEGSGVLVLESEVHARARGARVRGYLEGAASTCDAHHCTAPAPGGDGILRAMQSALAEAGLSPADVQYVNAHGTGTLDNDAAEGQAMETLFGPVFPWISSTKRFFGHTLAAAGAIEAVVSLLALEHQQVPANLGLTAVDPTLSFTPPTRTVEAPLKVAMSNSLGFGGGNCTLVFSGPEGL